MWYSTAEIYNIEWNLIKKDEFSNVNQLKNDDLIYIYIILYYSQMNIIFNSVDVVIMLMKCPENDVTWYLFKFISPRSKFSCLSRRVESVELWEWEAFLSPRGLQSTPAAVRCAVLCTTNIIKYFSDQQRLKHSSSSPGQEQTVNSGHPPPWRTFQAFIDGYKTGDEIVLRS